MRKKIIAFVTCCVLFTTSTFTVFADEVDDRIAEIENEISILQEELNALKSQKLEASGGFVDVSDYPALFTDATNYVGQKIKIAGEISGAMENDEKYTYFQFLYPLNGDSKSVVVKTQAECPQFSDGDYVQVIGTVIGTSTGENMFGGEVSILVVEAELVERSDYASANSPALKTLDINLEIEQYGYIIQLEKIEFAADETRAYVTVLNNGGSSFSLSDYSTKIVQGNTQYEYEYNYEADYPEIQSDLMPGTQSSGIITFPPMDPNVGFDVYFEGYSDNWDEDLNMYQFIINK